MPNTGRPAVPAWLAGLAVCVTAAAMLALIIFGEAPVRAETERAADALERGVGPEPCEMNAREVLAGSFTLFGDDLSTFDPRPAGYSHDHARAILCLLAANDGAAANVYTGQRFALDMAFPAAYGPGGAIVLLFLASALGAGRWARAAAVGAPLLAAALDVAENLVVREMVLAFVASGGVFDATVVESASALTVAKYLVALPCVAAAIVLATAWAVRSRGARQG